VLLLIEVAETTLASDRGVKLPLYATAGIVETWIVNLPDERIEVYAEPQGGAYHLTRIYNRGEVMSAHTISGLSLSVAEIPG
jgi:Uma2 family endonuclease